MQTSGYFGETRRGICFKNVWLMWMVGVKKNPA